MNETAVPMNEQSMKQRRGRAKTAATSSRLHHRGFMVVALCHVLLLSSSVLHAAGGAPCEDLQEATWDGLVRVLDRAQQYGYGILCPFEISGTACQSSSSTAGASSYEPYIVSAPNVLLICSGNTNSILGGAGAGDECLINCPQTHFDIQPNAGLALEGMSFSGSLNTSIIVRSFGRLDSSYSVWKNNGQLPSDSTLKPMIFGGAIQLHENSKATLEYNDFIDNKAFHGGSIYLSNNTSLSLSSSSLLSSFLSIRGGRFDNNRAIRGGGIYVAQNANSIVELQSTTFTSNRAVRTGASVHASSDTQYTCMNNKACDNSSDENNLLNCNGVEIQTSTEDSGAMVVCDSFIHTCETTQPTASAGATTGMDDGPDNSTPSNQSGQSSTASPTMTPSRTTSSISPSSTPILPVAPSIVPDSRPRRSEYPPSNEPASTLSSSESPTASLVSTSFESIQPSDVIPINVRNPFTNADKLSPSRNHAHISIMALPTAWPTFGGSTSDTPAPSSSVDRLLVLPLIAPTIPPSTSPRPRHYFATPYPTSLVLQEAPPTALPKSRVTSTYPSGLLPGQTNWPSDGRRQPKGSEELKMTIAPSFSPRLRTRLLLSDSLHTAPSEEQDAPQSARR